jgi:hypothetical protein
LDARIFCTPPGPAIFFLTAHKEIRFDAGHQARRGSKPLDSAHQKLRVHLTASGEHVERVLRQQSPGEWHLLRAWGLYVR